MLHWCTGSPQGYPQPVMSPLLIAILSVCSASSIIALAIACYSLLRAERPRLLAVEKRARDAQIELAGLSDSLSTMRDTLKRINSRTAMREMRAKKKGNGADGLPDPNENPEGWRAEMQKRFPRGVFDYNG